MTDDPRLYLARLLAEIEYQREEAFLRGATPYPRNNPIASDLGECAREYVLAMTHWQERPAWEPYLLARFARGNLIEDAVMRDLAALGFRVRTERRPFEIKDERGRVLLRGRVDGFVEWDGRQYPMEVKSVNPNAFQRLRSVEDLRRSPFFAKWPRQLWAYCHAHGEELAFFLLDDCLGHWRLILVEIDRAEVDAILRRCAEAVDHRDAGTLPEYHPDAEVCRRCWAYGRVCFPPASRPGWAAAEDPELEGKLDRLAALRAARDEWEDLDEEIKAAVKGKDGLVVGRWLVTGKPRIIHYKANEAHETEAWTTKIEMLDQEVPGKREDRDERRKPVLEGPGEPGAPFPNEPPGVPSSDRGPAPEAAPATPPDRDVTLGRIDGLFIKLGYKPAVRDYLERKHCGGPRAEASIELLVTLYGALQTLATEAQKAGVLRG